MCVLIYCFIIRTNDALKDENVRKAIIDTFTEPERNCQQSIMNNQALTARGPFLLPISFLLIHMLMRREGIWPSTKKALYRKQGYQRQKWQSKSKSESHYRSLLSHTVHLPETSFDCSAYIQSNAKED